jgi:hypothetical protein
MTRSHIVFASVTFLGMLAVGFAHSSRSTVPADAAIQEAVNPTPRETVPPARGALKSTRLVGRTGASLSDASGWLDIAATDFASGDHLVITIGGPATAVVVRLLPKNGDPSKPDMIVAEKLAVRTDHTVDVLLANDYKEIVQVSVHGGPAPWNMFNLGDSNGAATLVKVEHLHP